MSLERSESEIYRANFVGSLRKELLETVEQQLSPLAIQYKYAKEPLETSIKWRPLVLVLGNYSSGKSTLINDLLETPLQRVGQAPTDDSFTVLTYGENQPSGEMAEERDGNYLLNDPDYPFSGLKRHGQRFAAHFRLKKVKAPILQDLAIIDTPGMLDSVAERDRGYDYQEVIGDLAQIADLILVMFDPHRAGTVRETHQSLRETLPKKTFEDRILFVLNRIDECRNINDLLRIYGTLCWNLSQMTGRKDIPPIYLSYSENDRNPAGQDDSFLSILNNQRADIKKQIMSAPRFRLDHLATYLELHGERVLHMLEAMESYVSKRRRLQWKQGMIALGLAVAAALVAPAALVVVQGVAFEPSVPMALAALAGFAGVIGLWIFFVRGMVLRAFHRNRLALLDQLTTVDTQSREDTWQAVRSKVYDYMKSEGPRLKLAPLRRDHRALRKSLDKATSDTRQALNELAKL